MINRKDSKILSYVLPTDYANLIDKSGDVNSTSLLRLSLYEIWQWKFYKCGALLEPIGLA